MAAFVKDSEIKSTTRQHAHTRARARDQVEGWDLDQCESMPAHNIHQIINTELVQIQQVKSTEKTTNVCVYVCV